MQTKHVNSRYETKSAGDGDIEPEVKAALAELTGSTKAVLDRMAGELKAIKAQTDKLADQMERPSLRSSTEDIRNTPEHKAFIGYCRAGIDSMELGERKALVSSLDPGAGYLAPASFVAQLDRNLVQFSPVRAAARVGQTTAGQVQLPKRTTAMTGYWVGETEPRQSSEPAYGMENVPINEIAAFIDVSRWQLEDSAFDLETELALDFAEAFGAVEGAAFINGNGINKPEGIMAISGIAQVITGDATKVTADSLRTILYALPAFYRARSTWVMNSTTLASIAKLKTSGSGEYIWQPGMTDGQPDRLIGRPVIEAPDMPDEGAGAYPIVIGDFSRYRIFDRIAVSVLRDPFTQAASGLVRFHGRRRVGAQPTMTEAFRKLKCST